MKIINDQYLNELFHRIQKRVEGPNILFISQTQVNSKNKPFSDITLTNSLVTTTFDQAQELDKYPNGFFDSVVIYNGSSFDRNQYREFLKALINKIKYNGYLYVLDFIKSINNAVCHVEFKDKQLSALFEKYSKERNEKITKKDDYTWICRENQLMAFFYCVIDGKLKVPYQFDTDEYKDFIEKIFGIRLPLIKDMLFTPKQLNKKVARAFFVRDENGIYCGLPDTCYIIVCKKTNYLFITDDCDMI